MIDAPSIHFPADTAGLLFYILGLVILWVLVSIPVYFAGKMIKGGRATFGEAMGATLGGVLVFYIVFFVVAIALGAVVGPASGALALVLGLLAWLAVFRGAFHTSWLGAAGIVVLAWIILLILDFILVSLLGVKFPNFYPF